MFAIELRFPGGRYHATGWDHHVNEGLVEWPPHPWRLLRALVATWFRKLYREVPEAEMRRAVETLAGALPVYQLPRGALGHTRHYMPPFKGNTTKVFDAFVHLEDEARLVIAWEDVELDAASRRALGLAARNLGYLGRAESWVVGRCLDRLDGVSINCRPRAELDAELPPGVAVERVLGARGGGDFDGERAALLDRALTDALHTAREKAIAGGKDPGKAKVSPKDRAKIEAGLPASCWDALLADTSELRKAGWSQPPGSRWVEYAVPRGLLLTRPLARRAAARPARATVARYAVASQAPPRLVEALSVAERIRVALMSHSDAAPVFSGHDGDRPAEGHGHAHIIPEARARHGRISHVTVYAEMGFDEAAREALDRLTRVWGHGGHELQLVLLHVGEPEDIAGVDAAAGQCPLVARARRWRSVTPFVPTRHEKRTRAGAPKLDEAGRTVGSAEHDLVRLLRAQGQPEPVAIRRLPRCTLGGKEVAWTEFRTRRPSGEGRRAQQSPVGFELEFAEPIRGPLAVGYGAHFGLGVFEPA